MFRERVKRALNDFEEGVALGIGKEEDPLKKANAYKALAEFLITRQQLGQTIEAIPTEYEPPVVPVEEAKVKPQILIDPENSALNIAGRWIQLGKKSFGLAQAIINTQGPLSNVDIKAMGIANIYEFIRDLRKKLEEDPENPQLIITSKKGYAWRGGKIQEAVMDKKLMRPLHEGKPIKRAPEEIGRLYSLPETALQVRLSAFTISRYCDFPELMRKGVHFIVRNRGGERVFRKVTERGVERLKLIARLRREHPQMPYDQLAKSAKDESARDKMNAKRRLKPEEVTFTQGETVKLSHRLDAAREELARKFNLKVTEGVAVVWDEFIQGGGRLEDPERIITSLKEKLLVLASDPTAHYPRFAGNFPVQECLLLLQSTESPEERQNIIDSLLYPQGRTVLVDEDGVVQDIS